MAHFSAVALTAACGPRLLFQNASHQVFIITTRKLVSASVQQHRNGISSRSARGADHQHIFASRNGGTRSAVRMGTPQSVA